MAAKRGHDGKTGLLWSEPPMDSSSLVAEVALCAPVRRLYSFNVPAHFEKAIRPGLRIRAGVGRSGRLTEGYVLSLSRQALTQTLRPIEEILEVGAVAESLISLGREVADYYLAPAGLTLKAMAPAAVTTPRATRIERWVRRIAESNASGVKLTQARERALQALESHANGLCLSRLLATARVSAAVVQGLQRAHLIEIVEPPANSSAWATPPGNEPAQCIKINIGDEPPLTPEQSQAFTFISSRLARGGFSATLLFGVSGSGKTELYMRAIREIVERGREALFLVPEIALTTHLLDRVRRRFGEVAALHSALSDRKRAEAWAAIRAGRFPLIIGTRSAIFAPAQRLGLICMDEEQEGAYKNPRTPAYHAREAAILRARRDGIPLILGSATPSLESWRASETEPDWSRIVLRSRATGVALPEVRIVDMREEERIGRSAVGELLFSRMLLRRLRDTLESGGQALLLINRRGFATRILCESCGWRLTCPRCLASLALDVSRGTALCRICFHQSPVPQICPTLGCGRPLRQRGPGTQRLETTLQDLIPAARPLRMDRDSMRKRGDHERALAAFEKGEFNVLVGTQMIAKGLDFPGVRLVGVFCADSVVGLPDFRSREVRYQILSQVAGRAGRRGEVGEVIMQTHNPDDPILRHALRHNYEAFAGEELIRRRQWGYPPFRQLARLVFSHPREEVAKAAAQAVADLLSGEPRTSVRADDPGSEPIALSSSAVDILGPNPCSRRRIRERYRHELIVKTETVSDRQALFADLDMAARRLLKGARMVVDVDPVDLS